MQDYAIQLAALNELRSVIFVVKRIKDGELQNGF